MKEKVCYIVGAGSFDNTPFDVKKDDFVIAADGGYEYLKKLNIKANILLGDFDSLSEIPNHPNIIKHPKQKDDTDMILAVETGLELGYKYFVIYGGLGGRLDHTIANIQTITYISRQGATAYLVGEGLVITAITNGKIEFDSSKSGGISIFCSGSDAKGVYLKNLKYELNDAILTSNYPLGVSNEFIGKDSIVSVDSGTLVVMWNENSFNI
ncbi:MAG: thiamine diphosphokinase [Clostridia bacterium]|nr:thiamine diphosphokinase [Clostridia bacterium]